MKEFYFNTRLYDDNNKLVFCNNYKSNYNSISLMMKHIKQVSRYEPKYEVLDDGTSQVLDVNGYLDKIGYRFISEVIEYEFNTGGYISHLPKVDASCHYPEHQIKMLMKKFGVDTEKELFSHIVSITRDALTKN